MMIQRILVSFVITLALFMGCRTSALHPSDIETWTVASTDPLSGVGHGAILDSLGQEVDPAPAFVLEAQRYYLKSLYEQANERQRAEFKVKQRHLQEMKPLTHQEQILVNSSLIAWLLDAVKPEGAAHLASKNGALRDNFFRLQHEESAMPRLIERLNLDNLVTLLSATKAGGEAYIAECLRAGVPTPPDWGDPKWQHQAQPQGPGPLPLTFIVPNEAADVFLYETVSPKGVCLALSRSTANTIDLLGIICLGIETSKACFWDSQFNITTGTQVPLSRFLGGADLYGRSGGVCTDCHAGQNPFVVHPDTALDLGKRIAPRRWYEPIVHPNWPQNPGPTNLLERVAHGANDQSCLRCHGKDSEPPLRRFPELSTQLPDYCKYVLGGAIRLTMPSSPFTVGDKAFAKDTAALESACGRRPSTPAVINGATRSDPQGRYDMSGDLGACTGGDCPPGFCYWRTLHGPFWQSSDPSITPDSPRYLGSLLRIYVEGGRWKWHALSAPGGSAPNAPPGGTAECMSYSQIENVRDPSNCFAAQSAIVDPDGTHTSGSVDATVAHGMTADVLSGFIGNVAQSNSGPKGPDMLRLSDVGVDVFLSQNHTVPPSANPASPLRIGPLRGEAWINGCSEWVPSYAASNVFTESDKLLVRSPQARDVSCFITGITGAWSSTRRAATQQPFAEIYTDSGGDIRLRVSPTDGQDRVGAFASCIQFR